MNNVKETIRLVFWESNNEFIIEIDDKPIGKTITTEEGKIIYHWLKVAYHEIIANYNFTQKSAQKPEKPEDTKLVKLTKEEDNFIRKNTNIRPPICDK